MQKSPEVISLVLCERALGTILVTSLLYTIRELVKSLCRDGTDAQYMQYLIRILGSVQSLNIFMHKQGYSQIETEC